MAALVAVMALSFVLPFLFALAMAWLILVIALLGIDIYLLYGQGAVIQIQRKTAAIWSLGDKNVVRITVHNQAGLYINLQVFDELPFQFQARDFKIEMRLAPYEQTLVNYDLTPTRRGEYVFGAVNSFASGLIGLIRRKNQHGAEEKIAVYPSTVQMKKYELKSLSTLSHFTGVRKIRKIGHSYEYEQIKNYILGDDPRSINWKASSRRAELMVNQYMDEKSQQVYCILDKSRSMLMPFNDLSLLDHAINSTLAISNIVLQKNDKAGLLSFSDKLGSVIKADTKRSQLSAIYHSLYNEKEHRLEANYELLFNAVRNLIRVRSLLFLFTNFESSYAMERVLPILRKLGQFHLLVVIFFENAAIERMAETPATTVEGVYNQTVAQKFKAEKAYIIQELRKHKIQAIYTSPEHLTINTINKYLELKSRGLI
jgi:uncharacterized protein (DUF58 family)